MIEAIIAGCALGAVYALASGGLVVTYVSSGILNFAYAAIAFFVARFYYFLHMQHGWGIAPAAVVSVLCAGPALGVLLWYVLFRFIRLASPLIKIVVTIGLAVSIPPITLMLFGNLDIFEPAGPGPPAGPRLPIPRGARLARPDPGLRVRRDRSRRRLARSCAGQTRAS